MFAIWIFILLLFAAGAVFLYLGFNNGRDSFLLMWNGKPCVIYVISNEYVDAGSAGQAPFYEIVSGAYAGKRNIGAYASHPPLHKAGDTVEGRCDPRLARIESNKILRGQLRIAAMFQMIGLVPIILALMIIF